VDASEQSRERFQRKRAVCDGLCLVADLLETAEVERHAAIAAAHQAGLSVRQIAVAVRLSPARVHQLLHAPMSTSALSAAVVWQSTVTKAGSGAGGPLTPTTALLRECIDWLERLDRGELVAVNLSETSGRETEYVPVDRAQVRLVLQRIAQDLERQATGDGSQQQGPGTSRRDRLADLAPKPAPLSPAHGRNAPNSVANST
jgi:hypothetical protein